MTLSLISLVARVGFQMASYSTREGAAPEERLRVTVESDRAVTDGVVEVDIVNMTAKGERDHG